MNKYKTLLVNIGLFTINAVSTKLITFFLIPLYTYFLSTQEYGITDMSLTVAGLISPVVVASINDSVVRFIIDDKKNAQKYITIGFWISCIGCLISAALLPVLDLDIFGGLGDYKGLFFIYFVITLFSSFFSNTARGLNQIKLITWTSIISSLVSAASAGILIGLLRFKVDGYFYSLSLGGFVSIILFVFAGKVYRYIRFPSLKKDKYLERMLIYSFPLIPNAIFWWAGTSINRFFITSVLGIGASGLFAAASKIPNVMNLVSSTFWQAWSLSAFQEYKTTGITKFFSNIFMVFRIICTLFASLIIALTPFIASILLQKQFYTAWPLIPLLILAFFFNVLAGFYGTVFTTAMKTSMLFWTTVISAIAVIVFTALFIYPYGLYGAALAMIISNIVMLISRVFLSSKVLDIQVNGKIVLPSILLLVSQTVIVSAQIPNYTIFSIITFILLLILSIFEVLPLAKQFIVSHKK